MVQTTIRLPEKLYEKLKQEAKKRGMSLNACLISVLWDAQDYSQQKMIQQSKKGVSSDGKTERN